MNMDSDTRRKLVGMLGRLGSNADGEVVTAARLIEGWRKKLGLQWDDIIAGPAQAGARQQANPPPRPPPPRPQRARPGGGGHDFNDAKASAGNRVGDHFTAEEYQDLLDAAHDGTRTAKEVDFIADMFDRWERFGTGAFLTVGQKSWLEALAART